MTVWECLAVKKGLELLADKKRTAQLNPQAKKSDLKQLKIKHLLGAKS